MILYICPHEIEVMNLGNKKMGRPTDNPKNAFIKFRADDETIRKLKEASELLKVSQSEILRRGVHKMYDSLKKWKSGADSQQEDTPLPNQQQPKAITVQIL